MMKNINDVDNQTNLSVKSKNENTPGHATELSNVNGSSQEQGVTRTEIKTHENREEDDLMKRTDFRYFYSGRKLL
jgi:hypothetical protein